MLVPSSDSKDLLSLMCYWNKVRMACCQVMKSAMNTRTCVCVCLSACLYEMN